MRDLNTTLSLAAKQAASVGRKATLWLTALVIAGATMGCSATSDYMREAPTTPIATSSDKATVVFIRHSSLGAAIKFMIIDQEGRFIGESTSDSHFDVQLPPGEYLFIAEAENTDVLKATLAPGRTYYVEVDPRMGLLKAQVGLEPIRPGSSEWEELPELLSETDHWVPLVSEGQAALDSERQEITERVQEGKAEWVEYDAEEKAESQLGPDDGKAAPGAPPATPEPAVASSPPGS